MAAAAAAAAPGAAAADAYTPADLLKLQSNIKRDPDGYRDEFLMQYRHYQACLQLFQLKPSRDAREFGEFVSFVAQVSKCYPTTTAAFAPELMALLDAQQAHLDAALRRTVVQALILLRNRGQLDPAQLLPLLFRLFGVSDKALRQLLFRHIIADLKAANRQGHRSERLNRQVQAFLYGVLGGDNELAAKKSLAVLSELWRRNIWRDGRTVNCIASAVFHRSPAVMAAALRFFLGADAAASKGDDSDDGGEDDDGGDGENAAGGKKKAGASAVAVNVAPSREDVYKAMHKGTKASKKKKQAKLKRVMATLKKAARKEAAAAGGGGGGPGGEGNFAAIHLLHDPQGFAERLLSRLQASRERWELRLDMMAAVARVVGAHKLLLLNFYPFLQKYIAPHQRDVTAVLAAAVTAAHELVPPDSLAPLLRQLVDQFVHDRARPEVMTVGLKAVRELCLRAPLIMTEDLLQDLAEYRRFRGDKAVATAARALVSSFRELNPALLAQKDRGRGADLALGPAGYGVAHAAERLDGAALLEAALLRGSGSGSGSDSDEGDDEEEDGGSGSEFESGSEDEEEAGSSGSEEEEEEEEEEDAAAAAAAGTSSGGSEDAADVRSSSEAGSSGSGDEEDDDDDDEGASASGSEDAGGEEGDQQQQAKQQAKQQRAKKQQQPPQEGSLADLKKKLAAAKAAKEGGGAAAGTGAGGGEGEQQLPIEMTRILGADDFRRIRELKRRALVEAALARHGLKSAAAKQMSEAKKRRLAAAAEEEADEALALAAARAKIGEATLDATDLQGSHKRRKDKAERLASVMAGREGREAFGARSKLKKTKTGGRSEREKQRAKAMPIAARIAQLKNRSTKARQRSNPRHFKGRVKH